MKDPIENLEKMLASGQDSEMLRLTLGNAWFAKGEPGQAVQHFRKAVEMKPDYSAAWKMLGRALGDLGQLEEALVAFDQGLQVARHNGDKQAGKEITVFRKRVVKQLGARSQGTDDA